MGVQSHREPLALLHHIQLHLSPDGGCLLAQLIVFEASIRKRGGDLLLRRLGLSLAFYSPLDNPESLERKQVLLDNPIQ